MGEKPQRHKEQKDFFLLCVFVVSSKMYKMYKMSKKLRVPASKARADFADIINRTAFSKERVILHRHEKDLAAVISLEDLRLLERLLDESEARKGAEGAVFQLAAIVESSDDAIIGKTLDGVVTNWNSGAERLYGYSAKEIKGESISLVIPPERSDEMPRILERIKRGEQVEHFETVRVRKDGKRITISLTVSPIRNAVGEVIGASTIAHDITERKRDEEELRSSREQLRALSARLQSLQEEERTRIAREMQGRFGQVLTALKLDLTWLGKRLPVSRGSLQKKIESMTGLIDETIQAVRKISADLRPGLLDDLGLIAAIEWEIEEFKKRTGIECSLAINPAEITLDPVYSTTIFRILQEALINITQKTDANRVEIRLTRTPDSLLLKLIDNGGGDNGGGDNESLGLIGIRERALLFGGTVQIESLQGKGNIIGIEIPILQQRVRVERQKAMPERQQVTISNKDFTASGSEKTIRILIADNHAVVREGLKQILADIPGGVVAGEASSGKEVLSRIRKGHWDVIVMDISLPDKNGLEVLKQIKVEFPRLPVLVLSAYTEEQYAVRVLKAGASGYLTKESAPDQLIAAVQKVARGGQYVSETVAEKLLLDLREDSEKPVHKILSDREFQVLCLIASGKTLTEIARQLCLSIKTISTHRAKILRKMGMKNNAELIHYAVQNSLVG
jgi:two-component system, NarL family, invasion response regulator UvrY